MALNFLLKRSATASKRPVGASMAFGELDLNYDANTGGVYYKDSAGAVVKVGPAQVSATAPNVSPAGSSGNSKGEFWYDTSTSTLKIYDGTAWVSTGGGGGSGTVTSITAGTGLSGGTITTSGTISLDNACVVAPSAYVAKGDILAASAAGTPTALTVGTDGQVLTACAACTTGVTWAAAGGGGGGIPTTCITGKGALVTGTAANTPVALAVGSDNAVLTACAACTNGIYWNSSTGASPTRLGNVFGITDGAGKQNTALGCNALATVTVAGILSCFNVGIGHSALATLDDASCFNTAVGYQAGINTFTVSNNVLVGARAGCALTGGNNNTFVGTQDATCANTTTGANNVLLGYNARTATATTNNSVTFGNASITVLRAAVTTITSLSDARDKTDIADLPLGLEFINDLRPVKFTWEQREPNPVKDGTSEAGFIAQEVQQVEQLHNASDYLGLVYDENPEMLEVSPGKLIPVLVKAIQELTARVKLLESNS